MTLLELAIKIFADDQASQKIDEVSSGITGKLANAGHAVAGVMTAATAAAGAAAVAVGKMAFDSYAEFEQLEGGVQKLYGASGRTIEEYAQSVGKSVEDVRGEYGKLTEAQDIVMNNAQSAYKTMGLSANQYMSQVSSFSASLISSLGGDTVAAAERANVAMTAIADNVSIFGSDVQDVQNAFQGFAKQNYTMLDNLKLGYGGTKSEMERLIADANQYAASIGQASNLSIDSFADIVTAIDLVQQKQGIAGNAAMEASKTLEGSINSVKAAWQNLVTEIAKPDADIGARINDLMTALMGEGDDDGAINNVIKVVERIGEGLAQALPALIPRAMELGQKVIGTIIEGLVRTVPAMLDAMREGFAQMLSEAASVGPGFMEAGVNIVSGLIRGITDPSTVEQIKSAGFQLIQGIVDSISGGTETLGGAIGQLLGGIGEIITTYAPVIVEWASYILRTLADELVNAAPTLIEALGQIVVTLGESLLKLAPTLLETVYTTITSIVETILQNGPQIMESVLQVVQDIIGMIVDGLPTFFESVAEGLRGALAGLIETIQENGPSFLDAAIEFFMGLLDALVENLPKILEALLDGLLGLVQAIVDNAPAFFKAAIGFIGKLLEAIVEHGPEIIAKLFELAVNLIGTIISKIPDFLAAAVQLIGALLQAIVEAIPGIVEKLGEGVMSLIGKVADAVGDMLNAGKEFIGGLLNGVKDKFKDVRDFVTSIPNKILNALGSLGRLLWNAGTQIISGFWDGLQEQWQQVQNWFGGIGNWIVNNKGPEEYDRNLLVPAGRLIMQGFNKGLRSQMGLIENTLGDITGLFDSGMVMNANISAIGGQDGTQGPKNGVGAPYILIQEMNVQDKSDIYDLAWQLNSIWKSEAEGALA